MRFPPDVRRQFVADPEQEPPHGALYRYNRKTGTLTRSRYLWVWSKHEELIAVISGAVVGVLIAKSGQTWHESGAGVDKHFWTDDGHDLISMPATIDIEELATLEFGKKEE